MPQDSANPLLGVVHPNELYTLRSFKQRLGVTDSTLRAARRAGLRVIYRHKQGFIYGSDWINYILAADENQSPRPTDDIA